MRSGRLKSFCESIASRSWDNACRKRAERYAIKTYSYSKDAKDRSFEQKVTARPSHNQRRRTNREWTPMNANLKTD